MTHRSIARQRPQHTRGQQYKSGVFCGSRGDRCYATHDTQRGCFLLWSASSGYKGHGTSFEAVEFEEPACQDMRLGAKESN
jgi:hypothetical protein